MRIQKSMAGLFFAVTLLMTVNASAQTFTPLPLGGSTGVLVGGISGNGLIIVGMSDTFFGGGPIYWNNGVLDLLPVLPAYPAGTALDVNADGTIIVGMNFDGSSMVPVMWVNGVVQALANPANDPFLIAGRVSDDGNVIIGSGLFTSTGYVWNNGVQTTLTAGPGYISAMPSDLNSNGSMIVGSAEDVNTNLSVPILWNAGTPSALSLLAGTTSGQASSISSNGSVIGGFLNNGVDDIPVAWNGGTPTALALLAGNTQGTVSNINADGSVLVGTNNDGSVTTAVRWLGGTVESLRQILVDAGVDMAGWQLSSASGISADGTVIAGTGSFNGANDQPYFMTTAGLITPDELAEAAAPLGESMQQSQSFASSAAQQSIFAARQAFSSFQTQRLSAAYDTSPRALGDIAPAAGGGNALFSRHRWSGYVTGNTGFGQNDDFGNDTVNGTTGLIYRMSDSLAIGAGAIGGQSNSELRLNGDSRLNAAGAALIAAYEPSESGLRIYGMTQVAHLDLKQDRNYMNGAAVDGSRGDTDGMTYGAAVQAGWAFRKSDTVTIKPYLQIDASHTRLDGYTETGGAFPATVNDQKDSLVNSRLGAEIAQAATEDVELRARAAWGHRLAGEGASLTATTIGITQTIPTDSGERDWLELGGTAVYRLSERTTLAFDLSGRVGETAEPAVQATFGLNIGF